MKKPKKNTPKSLKDLQELGRKYEVRVTDMAKRVQAIGVLGGVRRQDQQPSKRPVSD